MQQAFIISRPVVHDPELMQAYASQAVPLAQSYGGTYLVRTDDVTALDGEYDGRRLIIMHFPDIERFRAFWNSPEYQELRKLRLAASSGDVWLVPGDEA